jgi:hypothetical protein
MIEDFVCSIIQIFSLRSDVFLISLCNPLCTRNLGMRFFLREEGCNIPDI